jgi:hypothetical protein
MGELAHHPLPSFGGLPQYQVGQAFNGLSPSDSPVKQEIDYSKVTGCTSSPLSDNPMFYQVAEHASSYVPYELDHIGCWYPLPEPNNGLMADPGEPGDL